jgi:hypothetical protein
MLLFYPLMESRYDRVLHTAHFTTYLDRERWNHLNFLSVSVCFIYEPPDDDLYSRNL